MSILDMQPPAKKETPQDVSPIDSTFLGIGFAWELGYTIAIPALVFGVGGGYLDKRIGDGTGHLFLFLGLALAFASSSLVIYRKLKIIMARMPKVMPKKKLIEPEEAKEQEAIHDLFRPNDQ